VANRQSSRRVNLQDIRLQSARNSQAQRSTLLTVERGVHAGLWLNKYISSLEQFKASSQDDSERSPQQKLVNEVASLQVPELYSAFYERWKQALGEAGAHCREFTVKGRMAVGLGSEGVLETSIALHHTYGVPYIPGSALKGLAASYARLMAGDKWRPGSEAYRVVFGDTENAGFLTFFDALYIPAHKCTISSRKPKDGPDCPLRPDIITVHHPEYDKGADAQGKIAPPADWDSPNPVPFLSATGCYLLALAAPDLSDTAWIEKAFDLLEQGLLILGIGAKTSSGYGRMERKNGPAEPEVLTEEDTNELQIINGYLQKIQEMLDSQITSQMRNIGNKCLILKSGVARRKLAKAIIEKARQTGKEDELKNQLWFQKVLGFSE
jgi:CRISPR-associated protein Cmr6